MSIMNFSGRVMKNLFSKPATTKYPFVKKTFSKATRGHIGISINDCIFCGICSKKCPPRVITVDRTGKKWEIDRFGCCQCGECVTVCPKKCLTMENEYAAPGAKKRTDVFFQEDLKKPEEK